MYCGYYLRTYSHQHLEFHSDKRSMFCRLRLELTKKFTVSWNPFPSFRVQQPRILARLAAVGVQPPAKHSKGKDQHTPSTHNRHPEGHASGGVHFRGTGTSRKPWWHYRQLQTEDDLSSGGSREPSGPCRNIGERTIGSTIEARLASAVQSGKFDIPWRFGDFCPHQGILRCRQNAKFEYVASNGLGKFIGCCKVRPDRLCLVHDTIFE